MKAIVIVNDITELKAVLKFDEYDEPKTSELAGISFPYRVEVDKLPPDEELSFERFRKLLTTLDGFSRNIEA